MAADAIERIRKRGKTPLLIGGTPFYYKAICGSLSEDLPKDEEVRRVLGYEIEEKGLAELHKELSAIDPAAAEKIHPNDPARTMRALEIFRITGRTATWWYQNQAKTESCYDIFYTRAYKSQGEPVRKHRAGSGNSLRTDTPKRSVAPVRGYSQKLPALRGSAGN